MNKKIRYLIIFVALISFFPLGKFILAQNNNLLTSPFLKINSDTEINGTLQLNKNLSFLNNYLGEISLNQLTQNQTYLLPNMSGEICLSSGNCEAAEGQGTVGRISRFGYYGFEDSSIFDNYSGNSIFINNQGYIGIGTDNPQYMLSVDGEINAFGDICTQVGGICLSQLTEGMEAIESASESIKDLIVEGEGVPGRIPVWRRDDGELGDSVIYQSGGNIGIGIAPRDMLDVSGTIRMLGFRLPVSPQRGYALMSDERGVGNWGPVLTPEGTSGADIAERFFISPDCKNKKNCPEPGDIISITDNLIVEKSNKNYDDNLIGIVSTEPGMTLAGTLDKETSRPIALIGRVPTNVSLENGEIRIGDLITSSNIPGVGKRAIKSGRVVGVALESLSDCDSICQIMVLVNPHFYHSLENQIKLKDKDTDTEYCIKIINGALETEKCD